MPGLVPLGEPVGEFSFDLGMLRVAREIRPLIRVGSVVVEFLGAVGIADETPVLGADGVIVLVVGRDRRPESRRGSVLQLGHEALAFQTRLFG